MLPSPKDGAKDVYCFVPAPKPPLPHEEIISHLEKYNFKQWGFVIIRCTYASQEKWDKFVRLAKQDTYDYFEYRKILDSDLYSRLTWTVIEDAETLDGASLVESSQRFREWVETAGGEEVVGFPRSSFFCHVDEESLESVVDDVQANKKEGYFCKVVYELMCGLRREAQEGGTADGDNDEEIEDEEGKQMALWDQRKKVYLSDLVDMYAAVLDGRWYNMHVEEDSGLIKNL